MSVLPPREPSPFWRRARRDAARDRQPVPPLLPSGTMVRVAGRGEVFVRYAAGPPGAPTVLLLHGWMASADLNWLGAFPALEGQYHLLAVDVRGHGRGIRTSEPFTLEDCAEDAVGLLAELGVRRAVVAGYSMGGPIALLMAREHPELVQGLVMVASAVELARSGLGRGLGLYSRLLGPLHRTGLPDRVVRQLARLVRRQRMTLGPLAELAPWLAGEAKRLHPADIAESGRAIARFDARPWASELRLPSVSVVTLRDRAVPPDKQRESAALLGGSVIELDGGHAVCTTHPALLGVAVRRAVDLVLGEDVDRNTVRRRAWLPRAARRLFRADGASPRAAIDTGSRDGSHGGAAAAAG